jgi:predicted enzyme related to lactoylglutathione lyase
MKTELIGGLVLYAADVDKLSTFYARALGFAIRSGEDNHVVLESHGLQLVVLRRHVASAEPITTPAALRSDVALKPVFVVSSIAAVRECANALGGHVDDTSKEWVFGPHTVCDSVDIEGNVFQLRERRRDS